MSHVNTIFALFAVVWAAGNVLMKMMEILNTRRDNILMGRIGDNCISDEHRSILLYSDWVPLGTIATFFSLVVGMVALVIGFSQSSDGGIALAICLLVFV